jgi:hypothetical protein
VQLGSTNRVFWAWAYTSYGLSYYQQAVMDLTPLPSGTFLVNLAYRISNVYTNTVQDVTYGNTIYDDDTGQLVMYRHSGDNGRFYMKNASDGTSEGIILILFSAGQYYNPGTDFTNSYTNYSIAWGDGNNGGVMESIKNINISGVADDTVRSEFYNNIGGLVLANYADVKWADLPTFEGYPSHGTNLTGFGYTSAPSTFRVKIVNTNGNPQYSVETSPDVYSPYFAPGGSGNYNFYFRNGADWAGGDGCYEPVQPTTDWLSNSAEDALILNYVMNSQGSGVPYQENIFGQNYYITYNQYPLKYLQPGGRFSNYTLSRDSANFNIYTNVFTTISNAHLMTNIYNVTNYITWLGTNGDTVFNITNDIPVGNIIPYWSLVWNSDAGAVLQQQTYFIFHADVNPPMLDFTGRALVDTVKTSVNSIYYNELVYFNLDGYEAGLPAFPDDTNFPAVP